MTEREIIETDQIDLQNHIYEILMAEKKIPNTKKGMRELVKRIISHLKEKYPLEEQPIFEYHCDIDKVTHTIHTTIKDKQNDN